MPHLFTDEASPEVVEEYNRNGADKCPNCGSIRISITEVDTTAYTFTIECHNCGTIYKECLSITGLLFPEED
jgi:transcription elongation factor Elf1